MAKGPDLPGLLKPEDVHTRYLRPSAILVRPGNPKGISGVQDLLRPTEPLFAIETSTSQSRWIPSKPWDNLTRSGSVFGSGCLAV